jgi:hypothetical protein
MNKLPDDIAARLRLWANAHGPQAAHVILGDESERAAADQVERLVQAMEQGGRWKEARVLRAEYYLPDEPESVRLTRLRRMGLPLSRAAYYIYLDAAEAFVVGAFLGLIGTAAPVEDGQGVDDFTRRVRDWLGDRGEASGSDIIVGAQLGEPSRPLLVQVAAVMRALGWKKVSRMRGDGRWYRGYERADFRQKTGSSA